jgi:CubicO group peptidase (beta-lactamase class C family)
MPSGLPSTFCNISSPLKFEPYIQALIRKKIIPGLSLLVAGGDRIIIQSEYGYKSIIPERENLMGDTIYDTASLTKPLVTAFLIATLLESNQIGLDSQVKEIFPDFPHPVTVIHLLTHSSGLPAWHPFFLYPEDYRIQLNHMDLESAPGRRINYSCPGYILLYYMIEKISGKSYIALARDVIFDRINLKQTFLKVPDDLKRRTAPTEKGNRYEKQLASKIDRAAARTFDWRGAVIQGDTHDLNAYHLGGTAGNSGLFSTTSDLFRLSREFFPESATILQPETIRMFWKNFTLGERSHRSLGFKLNTSLVSSGGNSISPFAIGHSGFTGTSIWLEPENRNVFILLTNRIHPRVRRLNFNRYRRRLHGLIKADLNLA